VAVGSCPSLLFALASLSALGGGAGALLRACGWLCALPLGVWVGACGRRACACVGVRVACVCASPSLAPGVGGFGALGGAAGLGVASGAAPRRPATLGWDGCRRLYDFCLGASRVSPVTLLVAILVPFHWTGVH
jgi:hypothetical protein